MRWDMRTATYFYTAGACFAVALMVAAIRLHLEGALGTILLWVGLTGFVVFSVAGFRTALIGEKAIVQKGHVGRMIGLYGTMVSAVAFFGFALTYIANRAPEMTPVAAAGPIENKVTSMRNIPPIGSLRYVAATLVLDHKHSTNQYAGRIETEIHNDSDKLIKFHAVTAGRINEVPFAENKVEFDGCIPAHESTYLVSNRLVNLPMKEPTDMSEPSVIGIYEYKLHYKYAEEPEYSRKTAKGLKIVVWARVTVGAVDTARTMPLRIVTYNDLEE